MISIIIKTSQAENVEVPVRITAGAYWKELPDAITYEATIPLTYEAAWVDRYATEWIKQPGQDCDNETQNCDVSTRISEMAALYEDIFEKIDASLDPEYFIDLEKMPPKQLEVYLDGATQRPPTTPVSTMKRAPTTSATSKQRFKRALNFIGDAFNWCCGVMTETKMKEFVMNEKELEKKVEALQTGLHEDYKHLSSVSQNFEKYDNEIKKAFETLHDKIEQVEDVDDLLAHNVDNLKYSVQTLQRNDFLALKRSVLILRLMRQNEILSACKNRNIPTALLTPGVLAADLDRLERRLSDYGLQLAIPRQQLSQYYKLPIVDCGIGPSKIIIHLKVPVTQNGRSWRLVELLTTPFGWHNDTCVIMHDTMYLAVSGKSMRPISGAGLHQCQPYHDRLCYLPRFSSDAVYGPQCAFKMYEGATVEEITKHCSFRCYRSDQTVISEVRPDTYVITHPQPKTKIHCPRDIKEVDAIHIGQPGALQVQLPCNCSLYVNNTRLIPARVPCGEDSRVLQVIHVLPATWSNLKSLKINPLSPETHPVYNNLSECLNHNWTFQVPHLNLSAISGTSNAEAWARDAFSPIHWSEPDVYSYHKDIVIYIWNTLLTIIVIKILYHHHVTALALVHLVGAEGTDSTHLFALYIIYIVTITTLCVFIVAYVIYFATAKFRLNRCPLCHSSRPNNITGDINLEEITEGTLTLPGGQKLAVRVSEEVAEGLPTQLRSGNMDSSPEASGHQ